MYLTAEKFVSGYDFDKDPNFDKIVEMLNLNKDDVEKSAGISVGIGYWRKANAIHNWFVQNVQGGNDECQRSYVSKEKLESLKTDCLKTLVALNNEDFDTVMEILAPTSGFFFGSQETGKWYKQDLENTVKIIDKALDKFKDYDIYYQASW